MDSVRAQAIETPHFLDSVVHLDKVSFDAGGELVVTMARGGGPERVSVTFESVLGFRVLDEGDLLEFWPACSGDKGWFFRIEENGWFDLELSRSGFVRDKGGLVAEYFILGQNECVSVLSGYPPVVSSHVVDG